MKKKQIIFGLTGMLIVGLLVSSAAGETQSRFPFTGRVTGNHVHVRSGPDINFYAVTRLMEGNAVQVVDEKHGWYRIVPPEGCFSLVNKDFVERTEGRRGVITGDTVSILAGSTMTDRRRIPQMLAGQGMEVTIVGEEENWYRLLPPEGAHLWISKDFVRVASQSRTPASIVAETEPAGELKDVTVRPEQIPTVLDVHDLSGKKVTTLPATTRPAGQEGDLLRRIEELDEVLQAEMKKPLGERRFEAIEKDYAAIAEQAENEDAAKHAENRLAVIDYQKQGQQGLSSLKNLREEFYRDIREVAVQAVEIESRDTSPAVYRLQGTGKLLPSMAFEGPLMPKRFRLFDEKKGRTVAYVELAPGTEINMSQFIGRDVSVYGTAEYDARLGIKIIKADAFREVIEPAKAPQSQPVIEEDQE